MGNNTILLLKAGFHREFALKTLFRKGFEVIIIDSPFSRELAYADYPYITSDISNPQKLFELAVSIYKTRNYSGVFTTTDSCIITLGMLSDYFELNYFSEKTARMLVNKLEVRKYLKAIGADNTAFFEINSLSDLEKRSVALSYPFILKPTDRSAGKGVVVIRSEEELKEAYDYVRGFSKSSPLIAEEFIDGEEYCIEAIVCNGVCYTLDISKKKVTNSRYCIELTDITPAPLSNEWKEAIEAYIKDTVSELEISNGILHIEFKLNGSGQPRIIEINPRPAGGNLIEAIYDLKGLNVYDYAFDLAMKREIHVNKLKGQISQPIEKFALFNSFISPTGSGIISNIRGIDKAAGKFENDHEKLILFYGKGDYLPAPETNGEARGSIYLLDSDFDNIVKRSEEIENSLEYQFE